MKMIKAIIKPFKLGEVRKALMAAGIEGLTVIEVKGFGRQLGKVELYRGVDYSFNFLPKLVVEVVVTDERLPGLVRAIAAVARTGKIGDGKIFVLPIDGVLRIRTAEVATSAN